MQRASLSVLLALHEQPTLDPAAAEEIVSHFLSGCIELLKYFTDEEAQKYTGEVAGKIPVTNAEIDYEVAPKQLSYVNDILAGMTGTLGFYNESLGTVEAGDTFDNNMVAVVLGQKTVDEALESINEFFEDEMW